MDLPPGALDGIRIVDLSTILMGPYAARILGDLGADVIRIESLQGDSVRNSVPARTPGMSGIGLNLLRNKRSVALDLKAPAGREAALAIMGSADAVITNMRRAALVRLGLDPASVRALHPRLIYCVGNGYGSGGPYADRPAYDDAIQASSGLAWLIGQVQGEPQYVPAIVADKVCGMTIAQAVLAALVHQLRTGQGQTVEVPMFETMVAFNLVEHLRGTTFEPPLGPFGYARLFTEFRRPFRTADGYATILPYNDKHWLRFFEICGRSDLVNDERFGDHNARIRNVDALYALIAEVAPTKTTAQWLALCEEAEIPATEIMDLSRAEDDPHLQAVGLIELVDHPTEGTYRHLNDPVHYSATPTALRRMAAPLGTHTDEVLTEVGYDPAQIAELRAAAVAG